MSDKPGWVVVGKAFLEAPGRRLTNVELGALPGVQAFRSRISDLRRMGWPIGQASYVKRGVWSYQLERGWHPGPGWSVAHPPPACSHDASSAIAARHDDGGDALFNPDGFAERPASALTES